LSAAAQAVPLKGWRLLAAAFRNRKLGVMLAFGFSAGLPYALLLGTLYAWLGEAQVDLETMGVFSLIGLAYAFKFLWSPLVDRIVLPGLELLGRRRSWLLPIQFALGAVFITLSSLDPQSALGWFSLLAGIGAFASATQDIVIDAWRVDVADDTATLEILSAIYQLGYRAASLVGGALALIAAARLGWPAASPSR
jgi:MFS transporter, PAT family, beta-lactamase induction signal transducer AmpG